MLNAFCKYFTSCWVPEMMLFLLFVALPRVWVPLHDCMGMSPSMGQVQWFSQLEPWMRSLELRVWEGTWCTQGKNVECNLAWTEVGVQVRADALAHVHWGDLMHMSLQVYLFVHLHPMHVRLDFFFLIAVLIRAMTSCFLVLVCYSVEWRNFSFHLASYCFQRRSWNSEFLRSIVLT